jgi:hypothetical protein
VFVALLAATGCGGPSSSDKSKEGVRSALSEYGALVKEGKTKEACENYFTVAAKLAMMGQCEELSARGASDLPSDKGLKEIENSITIDGNTATWPTASGTGEMTYVDGSWKFAPGGATGNGTNPEAGAKVEQWPDLWCEAYVGMTKIELEDLMGPATDPDSNKIDLIGSIDQESPPEPAYSDTWEAAGSYQYNAFFSTDDTVQQLDFNGPEGEIGCDDVRVD